MVAELRSRELLVGWVAYCLADAAAVREHPLLAEYGVSLRVADLRHLVLGDRAAVDAALAVATYLHGRCSASSNGGELFSLRDGGAATFQMAEAFAKSSPEMLALWEEERIDADARQAGHWVKVTRKQQLASQLQHELDVLEAAKCQLESNVRSAAEAYRQGHGWNSYESQQLESCRAALSSNQQQRVAKQTAITQAEKAPPPVVQPLPRDPGLALQWIFFLHMPHMLRQLSRASFLAQQLLLPRGPCPPSVAAGIAVTGYMTSIAQHYNDHQSSEDHTPLSPRTGQDGAVEMMSRQEIPKSIGPSNVKHMQSWDGVWHPDSLQLAMAWPGSGCKVDELELPAGYFDPFSAKVPHAAVVDFFTEQLRCEPPSGAAAGAAAEAASGQSGGGGGGQQDHPLQWGLPLYGSVAAERGNVAIAWQGEVLGVACPRVPRGILLCQGTAACSATSH